MGDVVHVLEETIECHRVVKVFGGQDYEAARFRRAIGQLRGFNMRQKAPEALITPVTHLLAAAAMAVIVYVALREALAAQTTVGEFASTDRKIHPPLAAQRPWHCSSSRCSAPARGAQCRLCRVESRDW